jgi:hypothetical protein
VLARRCSTVSAIPPAIFALVILEIGSHFLLRPAWTSILFYSPTTVRLTGTCHHTQLFSCCDGGLVNIFCLDWPGTMVLLISGGLTRPAPQRPTQPYFFNVGS